MAFTDFIAPIAGTATGLIGNAANVYMQNRQNEENQRLAQQNNQWNIDQWNRANEYNTPANQMKRLRDAGLNTSLMYGSPTNVAISSPQADTSNKGQAPKVDFNSIVSNAQQMMLQQQLTKAQVDNVNADTQAKQLENNKKQTEQPFWQQNAQNQANLLETSYQTAKKNIEVLDAQLLNINAETMSKNIENAFNEQTFDTRVNTLAEQYNLTKEQVDYVKQQSLLAIQKITTEKCQQAMLRAQTANQKQELKLIQEKIRTEVTNRANSIALTNVQVQKIASETKSQDIQNTFDSAKQGEWLTKDKSGYNVYGLFCHVIDDTLGAILSFK